MEEALKYGTSRRSPVEEALKFGIPRRSPVEEALWFIVLMLPWFCERGNGVANNSPFIFTVLFTALFIAYPTCQYISFRFCRNITSSRAQVLLFEIDPALKHSHL